MTESEIDKAISNLEEANILNPNYTDKDIYEDRHEIAYQIALASAFNKFLGNGNPDNMYPEITINFDIKKGEVSEIVASASHEIKFNNGNAIGSSPRKYHREYRNVPISNIKELTSILAAPNIWGIREWKIGYLDTDYVEIDYSAMSDSELLKLIDIALDKNDIAEVKKLGPYLSESVVLPYISWNIINS